MNQSLEAMEINVRGLRLRVLHRPPQSARPPLVLMSGLGASLELFGPFVDALDPTTGVVLFDVPGVGRSDTPAWPYRFSDLARDVDALVDALGYNQVDVLGVSWGGFLAQHFAGRHPKRCRRLVLVSTAPCTGAVPGSVLLLKEMLSRRRYIDSDYAMEVAPHLYGGSVRSDPSLVKALHNGSPASTRGYLYQWAAALSVLGPPIHPRIHQPTLILAGDDDPLIPLINARMLRASLPNARLRIFDDGHLGLVTRAPELANIVDEFLARKATTTHGHVESALYLTAATARHVFRSMTGRSRTPTSRVELTDAGVVMSAARR